MPNTNLPIVDDAYLSKVFTSLETMDVDLDSDPIIYGPKRLNAKVAQCRTHLTRCQSLFMQVSVDLHALSRALRQARLEFDLQMQDLFANDPDVRSGKNVRDREAIATMKLRAEREAIQQIESSVTDLESVLGVVKNRREDLKDVQGRIRDQVKLCQEEIALGGQWGSALPPGQRPVNLASAPKVDTEALAQMQSTFSNVEGDASISDLDAFLVSEGAALEASAALGSEGGLSVADPVVPVVALVPDEAEEDEAEPALPEVAPREEPPVSATASADDVTDFLDSFGPEQPKAKAAVKPVTSDVDLDDLLGSFS